MLPSTSPWRLFLLVHPFLFGTPILLLWSPPSLNALILISFFLIKMWLLVTLTVFLLMIWCFQLTAVFLFLLARATLAYLPIALSVALKLLFPFQQAQYTQVFLLKSAPFCTLFASLRSTNKFDTCLLLSDSRSIISTQSSPSSTSNSLAETFFSLLLFYQATMGPRTLVSPRE